MAGGLDKGTRADQPAAGGAQRWGRQPVGWPVGPVVFLHTPVYAIGLTDTKKGRTGIAPTYLQTTPRTLCCINLKLLMYNVMTISQKKIILAQLHS